MRLLLHSRFHPSVGGIETVASLLANEWTRAGESVTVVTDVRSDPATKARFSFPVRHRPQAVEWIRLLRSHDVFVHFNISLRALWPLLLIRRPFIASHHGYYVINRAGERDWRERLKLLISRRAGANIAPSQAIAREIGLACCVIPNPYDSSVFSTKAVKRRDRELIFVGRLVSDKGIDLLIRALAILNQDNLKPSLTIVGDGPEQLPLESLRQELRLEDQIIFVGSKSQLEVANLLQRHQILVVPSLWREPFGLVALEGIASGCVVVGSNGGGLPEAIGPCGLTFPNGDVDALADRLRRVLTDEAFRDRFREKAASHLDRHRPTQVAEQYLKVIRQACSK